jgi:hypothetical protein
MATESDEKPGRLRKTLIINAAYRGSNSASLFLHAGFAGTPPEGQDEEK